MPQMPADLAFQNCGISKMPAFDRCRMPQMPADLAFQNCGISKMPAFDRCRISKMPAFLAPEMPKCRYFFISIKWHLSDYGTFGTLSAINFGPSAPEMPLI
jgi:hypothetical protein